jgi:RHS repeat-associated protein
VDDQSSACVKGLSVRVNNAALTEERAFDILDRMTNLVYRNASAAIVGSFSYRYDVLGLVTQKIAYVAATSVTNLYAYDKIGRLTNEITRSGGTTTTRFTYDLAGNRLTAGASTYTYANNRLNGALHDTAGNITNLVRGTTTLRMSWNTQGQLVSVTTNNVLAESYAYDPLGRRVKTTAGGATVYHVYQGDECAADLDSSGNPLRSYTFGQGIDNLLAMTVYTTGTTNTYYAVKDHLGSVQALVNAAGSMVESYTYDAWGVTTIKNAGGAVITASQFGNRFMFQGREYSTATALYNFRARWYAPTLGRWLSKDPIGLEGGLNLYAFCGNNAVNSIDPWGMDDINLYHPVSIARLANEKQTPPTKEISVGGHGTPDGDIVDQRNGSSTLLELEKLAKEIKALPKYETDKPIRLGTCYGAKAAVKLSKILPNPVIGSSGITITKAQHDRDGKIVSATTAPDANTGGKWETSKGGVKSK